MAGGRGIIGDDGKLLIRSDGTVDVCEECCGDTPAHRLILCDGTGTDLYVGIDDADEDDGILYNGTCHTAGVETTLPNGGTLLDAGDFTIDADCCLCGDCGNDVTPSTIQLVFSGVTNCCSFNSQITDNVNGTYCLSRVGSCAWQTTTTVNRRTFTSGTNCGGGTWTDASITLTISVVRQTSTTFLVQVAQIILGTPTNFWFEATHTGSGCGDFVVSNGQSACAGALTGSGGVVAATMNGC